MSGVAVGSSFFLLVNRSKKLLFFGVSVLRNPNSVRRVGLRSSAARVGAGATAAAAAAAEWPLLWLPSDCAAPALDVVRLELIDAALQGWCLRSVSTKDAVWEGGTVQ
jgi:hypothetical protein